jgi:hypothetical protein
MVIMLVGLVVLGVGLFLLTNSFLQAIKPSAQQSPEQAPIDTGLLLLGITMLAGLPAIGIGTYLAYSGNQIRITSPIPQTETGRVVDPQIIKRTSPRIKGPLLIVSGGLIIVCALVLPLVVWWMTQTS